MAKCLNCYKTISKEAAFCSHCGAKIVSQRITLKKILSDVAETIFGWDNKYLFTARSLLSKPHVVLEEYISGVRKRYVHPFTFLVIGATIMLFTYTLFLDSFMENLEAFNMRLVERYKGVGVKDPNLERVDEIQGEVLKYFNIVTLLLMPLYALFTYIIYRKTYNYAEHLVFNSYIRGVIFIITVLFFYLSLVTHPLLFFAATIATWVLHAYSFGKLYRIGVGMSILKLVLFEIMLVLSIVLIITIVVLLGILTAYLK